MSDSSGRFRERAVYFNGTYPESAKGKPPATDRIILVGERITLCLMFGVAAALVTFGHRVKTADPQVNVSASVPVSTQTVKSLDQISPK